MPSYWRDGADIHWCSRHNIPLLGSICLRCGSQAPRIHASPPRDIRPAFQGDRRKIRGAVGAWGGEGAYDKLLEGKLIFLNKIPYVDQADEVIVDGWSVGHVFYDPLRRTWRFRPTAEGVARAYRAGLGHSYVVEGKIRRGEVLSSRVGWRSGTYVGLINRAGESVGLGVVDKGKLVVIKRWRPQKPHFRGGSPNMRDVVKTNEEYLESAERRARLFIAKYAEKYDDVVVSFSGGKDSMALLLVAIKELGDRVKILFNNTGIEAPQTIKYVAEVADKYGLELIEANAMDGFWRGVDVFGPPARDYRWCCKVAKLVPIARAVKERFGGREILMLVGQRRWESLARFRSPMTWRNRWIPHTLVAAPINDWTALHVWLYLFRENAPINPLYKMGFDRIGCWLCPASELGELEMVKGILPKEWAKWEGILRTWGKGLPGEWVDLGLWRWRRLPGDQIRNLQKIGIDPATIRDPRPKIAVPRSKRPLIFRTNFSYDLRSVANLAETMGEVRHVNGMVDVRVGGEEVIFKENEIIVKGDERLLRSALTVAMRVSSCVGCGSCLNWCPTGALIMDGQEVKLNPERCIKCGVCNDVCPLGQYIVRYGV